MGTDQKQVMLLDSAINSYFPSPDLYKLRVVGIQETYWRASNLKA